MATIDASIPLGVRPVQIESPVNQLAKVLQIQEMQQGQQMNRLKMDEYQRGIQEQQELRSALASPDADPYKVLTQRGRLKEAMDWQKGKADVGKTEAEAKAKQIETAKKQVELAGQAFGYVRANPTVENAMSVLDALERQQIYSSEQVAQMRQMVQANPQNVAGLADQAFRMALDAKEQLAKIQTNNIGGSTVTQAIDPVTNRASLVSNVQNTQSPDNAASNARMAADAAAGRAVTVRGQDLVDARTREQNTIAAQGNSVKAETDLRKEFADLPEVKRYKAAYPSFAAIEKAAQSKNPQADINLIYGLAKLYDPDSVVREGEYATIANSQAIPEWLKGQAQALVGGGKLSAETKRQILEQARARIATFENEFTKAQGTYEQVARQRGANPDNIFTPAGKPRGPKVGTVQDGYRYKGGDPGDPKSWEKQ